MIWASINTHVPALSFLPSPTIPHCKDSVIEKQKHQKFNMVNNHKPGIWGAALGKLRKTSQSSQSSQSATQATREQETPRALAQDKQLVYPRFQRPVSDDAPVYSEFMFPPTPLPTVPMAENSNLDPLAMASTISMARLNALQSGKDLDLFIQRGKDCIDAYAQATKAMMEEACARVKDGEVPPHEEIERMKERFYKYCQSIVEEGVSLVSDGATHHPRQAGAPSNSIMPSMISSTSTTISEPRTLFESGSLADRSGFSETLVNDLASCIGFTFERFDPDL